MVVVGVVTARSSTVTACACVAEPDRNPEKPGVPGTCSCGVESVARTPQVDGSVAPTHVLPSRVVVPVPRTRSRTCSGVPATYVFTAVTASQAGLGAGDGAAERQAQRLVGGELEVELVGALAGDAAAEHRDVGAAARRRLGQRHGRREVGVRGHRRKEGGAAATGRRHRKAADPTGGRPLRRPARQAPRTAGVGVAEASGEGAREACRWPPGRLHRLRPRQGPWRRWRRPAAARRRQACRPMPRRLGRRMKAGVTA